MRLRLLPASVIAGLMLAGNAAWAIEHRSVAQAAVLYDAPSAQARKLYVIRPQTPVEIIVTLDKWIKVRDKDGTIAWIQRGDLSEKHTLIVRVAQAKVFQRPADDSPLAFELAQNVVVEMLEAPTSGWIKIRHQNGDSGYVRVGEVWGF